MENLIYILKIISQISYLVFTLFLYFGIVGFSNPWKSIGYICLISFILFIITLIPYYILSFIYELKEDKEPIDTNLYNKFKKIFLSNNYEESKDNKESNHQNKKSKGKIILEYFLPIFIIISVFLWTKFIAIHAPVYGEYIIYNPFYLLGLGQIFHGNEIQSMKPSKCNQNIEMKSLTGGFNTVTHTWYTQIYAYILTIISALTYIFGNTWSNGFQMISTIFTKTLFKILLGYEPVNNKLLENKSKFLEYMQYRVASLNTLSKIAAAIRRYTLIGLDMPAVDIIFPTVNYNNILSRDTISEYCTKKKIFEKSIKNGTASYITEWKWEILPFIRHWVWLSFIGYILGIVLLLIGIFIK